MIEKTIKIIIKKEKIYMDGTAGYFAESPQLKGILVFGEETIEETLLGFAQALTAYMKSVIKHGDKI